VGFELRLLKIKENYSRSSTLSLKIECTENLMQHLLTIMPSIPESLLPSVNSIIIH